ncbi:MAG: DUF1579 family protein [Chloroflexota bacterium]
MRILIALLLSLFTAAVVSAQDMTPEPTAEPTPEPYVLTDANHQLDWFIGSWDVQSRLLIDSDTDQWMEETATSTVEPIIGGFALLERFDGTYGGTPIQAVSVRIYNSSISKWQQRWTDSTSPGFAPYTGQFIDGEFIAYSDSGYSPEIEGGTGEDKTVGAREVFFDIEEDHFSWRWETSYDGGETWDAVWTLEYTRAM